MLTLMAGHVPDIQVDEKGRMTGQHKTYAVSGDIRRMVCAFPAS